MLLVYFHHLLTKRLLSFYVTYNQVYLTTVTTTKLVYNWVESVKQNLLQDIIATR